MRALTALALLALACGGATESPRSMGDSSPEPVVAEVPASVELARAQPSPEASTESEPEPATTPAPSNPAPIVQPKPTPAPTPAPAPEVTPDPPAQPEPTPADPLVIDCIQGVDCTSCLDDLRATHPDWYDSGAATCRVRSCSAAAECDDLGAGLVCAADGGPSGTSTLPICRAPRIVKGDTCLINERTSTDGHAPVCEPGLSCVPFLSTERLTCQVYKP